MFIVVVAAYLIYLIVLLKNASSLETDFYLLLFAVLIILTVNAVVITTFFVRPKVLLETRENELVIHQTRKKSVVISFFEVTGFGRFRQNLVVTLKNNKMYVIRFLSDVGATQTELGNYLNTFINDHSDRYFAPNEDNYKNEQ